MKRVYGEFDEDRPVGPGTKCTREERKTRDSDGPASDINVILKKYEATGMLPERREGFFADVSSMPSYQEALAQVSRAREVFMKLPAEVRAAFGNDPAVMLDAWNAGEQGDLFERIGWLEKAPTEAPAVEAPSKAPEASKASA